MDLEAIVNLPKSHFKDEDIQQTQIRQPFSKTNNTKQQKFL